MKPMKSSEATPLTPQELEELRSLMQRWVLRHFPCYDGSSEMSDATTIYSLVKNDTKRGTAEYQLFEDETEDDLRKMIEDEGETFL